MTDYPRDLVGYADQPPDPRWPSGAYLALNFVINYEEGGERSVLHGDKVAETRLTDLLMPAPLQGARDLNIESAYEYGSRVGFWRLMRVFAERQVIPTIYAVGMALERNPQVAEAMARQGCDVVDHGWRWLDYHGINEATEREHIRLSVETIRRLTGTRPIGWYIGTPSANTRRLGVEEGGVLSHLPVSSITSCAATGSGSAGAARSLSIGGASTHRPERKDERAYYLRRLRMAWIALRRPSVRSIWMKRSRKPRSPPMQRFSARKRSGLAVTQPQ